MRRIPYLLLDVFTDRPFAGNQLCVILDGTPLSGQEMQSIAQETNLPETTFVLPPTNPGATYRNRIFTPGGELPFAGHPTLGTAAALTIAGRISGTEAVQESKSGLTPLTLTYGPTGEIQRVDMVVPQPRIRTRPDPVAVAAVLGLRLEQVTPSGLAPAAVEAGVSHLVVPVESPEVLASIQPDTAALKALSRELGVVGAYPFALLPDGGDSLARARLFAPLFGIPEDPATGSAAPLLGHFLDLHGLLAGRESGFWYEQGVEMGRPSRLWVKVDGVRVEVGGQVRLVGEGQFLLE